MHDLPFGKFIGLKKKVRGLDIAGDGRAERGSGAAEPSHGTKGNKVGRKERGGTQAEWESKPMPERTPRM